MAKPIITIITVVYNAVDTLDKCISSVLEQQSDLFEYWIIDGCSTDGSLEIIKKHESRLAGWVSESDKGIYDAMNKGIDRSNGSWLYFLGADDVMTPGILAEIQSLLDDKLAILFGKVTFTTGSTMTSSLGKRILMQNTVHHQSAFYNSRLFNSFRYDTSFKAISDYELNLKVWIEKLNVQQVNLIIACCYASGTSNNFDLSLKETNLVRRKVIKNPLYQFILSTMMKAYYFQKKIRNVGLVR